MQHKISPQSRRGLQLILIALVMAGMWSASGCGWMRRGQQDVAGIDPAGAGYTAETDMTPSPREALPVDQPVAGPRPGDLTPLPQLRVIYFDFDRASLRPDQLADMENNLRFLQDNPDVKVMITGHCDERGSIEYNFNLGMRRASSVQQYYVANGIGANRIAISSKGKDEPAVLGSNEAAWAQNRRAEFHRMH